MERHAAIEAALTREAVARRSGEHEARRAAYEEMVERERTRTRERVSSVEGSDPGRGRRRSEFLEWGGWDRPLRAWAPETLAERMKRFERDYRESGPHFD